MQLLRGGGGGGGQASRIRFEEEKAGKVHSCGPGLWGRKEGGRTTSLQFVQFGKRIKGRQGVGRLGGAHTCQLGR